MEPQRNAIIRQYMHPHKSCQNDTTNLSQGYNQVYFVLNTAILEKSQRIFSVSSKVFKKVLKVIVRIIYISQEKSYNHPKTVSNIHKCLHFKWNKFCPQNYQVCKFCIILCNCRTFKFCRNSQENLTQKKHENLVCLTYNSCT